jgi:hypothetical protein
MQEVQNLMNKLDKNELQLLTEEDAFKISKMNYEAAFMEFLSNKYNNEFLTSSKGEEASKAILEVTKQLIDKVNYANRVKQEKYDKLLAYLEANPDILK